MFKIEKGIPLPRPRSSGMKATMDKIKVGESFVIDDSNRQTVYNTATRAGIKVTIGRDADKQTRVWRTA